MFFLFLYSILKLTFFLLYFWEDYNSWLLVSQASKINNVGSKGHTSASRSVLWKSLPWFFNQIVTDLHLKMLILVGFDTDRNWNINLPGFAGDEIKTYRKPVRISIDLFQLSTILCSIRT